jgi:hypothetical protein
MRGVTECVLNHVNRSPVVSYILTSTKGTTQWRVKSILTENCTAPPLCIRLCTRRDSGNYAFCVGKVTCKATASAPWIAVDLRRVYINVPSRIIHAPAGYESFY